MNKRILELAEQAGFVVNVDAIDWASNYDRELQQFAELIIQECIDAVLSGDRPRREYFAEKLKQRFGMSNYEEGT